VCAVYRESFRGSSTIEVQEHRRTGHQTKLRFMEHALLYKKKEDNGLPLAVFLHSWMLGSFSVHPDSVISKKNY
jgi:hypothetical protein